ncbi:zinc transporter 2 [Citrus sinensis]|uniref:Zinc transporter 2 n=1 Tax=Citrus sinensis TaxID=2711 RepID=A0ACB8P1C1_CITSI|nr:zinc transporter 2 [Citrus sinensis]
MSRFLLALAIFLSLILLTTAHSGHDDDEDEDNGTETEPHNLRSKPLILVKIWCLMIIFVGTFVGGVSPYFLKWNEGFLVLGTQFAGGVFLGTALMHFLSDANETFGDLTSKEYPFAFMLACAGYLFTMLADCAISFVLDKKRDASNADLERQDGHSSKFSLTAASSLGDSILLIVALCFHSVFEGIAIGIFAAIAMGIALLRMIPDRPLLSCVAYAFAFAISSPVGVAIGIIIDATTQGPVADWIFAISMGLACGVFIYVSINHLLSKGYTPQKTVSVDTPNYKFLAVVLGVGVIAVVMIWDT